MSNLRELEHSISLAMQADQFSLRKMMRTVKDAQKAGKPFEMMIYPKSRHGVSDPALVKHMQTLIVDFIMRTLTPGGARASGADARPTAKR